MTGDPELLRLASIKTLVNRKSRRRSDATRQSTHLHRKNLSTHYPAPDRDAVSLGASWFGGRPSAPSVSTRDTGSKTEGSIAASETSGDATASEVDFDTVSTSTGTSLYRLHQQQAEAVRLTSFCCAHRGSGEELLAASLSTSSLLVLRRSPPPDAALPPPPPQQQQPAQARRWLVAMPQIFDGAAIEALAASPDHQCILVLSSNAALHLLAIAELEQEVGADAAAAASTRSIAPPGARHGAPRGGAAVLGPSLAQMTRSARGSTATHSSISAGIEEVFAEPVTVKQLPQDRRAQQGRGAAKQSPAQQQRLCCVWWQTDGGAHIAVVSAAAAGASRVHFVDMATSNRFTLQLQGASAVTALRIVRLEAAAQRLIFLLATCADGAAHSVLLEMGLPLPPPPPLEEAAAAAAEEAQEGQAAAAAVEADDSGLQVQPPLAEGGQAEAAAAPAAAAPPPPPPYWQLTQHTSGNTRAAPVRIDTLAGASALFILDAVSSSGSGDGGAEGGGELRLAAVSRNGAQLQIFAASADALYQCHRDKRRSAMSAVMLLTVAIPVLLHGAAPPAALLLSSAAAAAAAAEAAAPRPRRCVCAALYALPGALLLLECAAALPTVAAAAADAEAPWRAPPAATALTKAVFKLSRGEALVWAEACSGSSSGASGGGAALSSEESEALGFSVCTTQSVYMLSLGRAGGGDATAGAASPPPRTGKVSRSPPMRVPHGAHKEGREAGQLLAQARRLHEAGKRYQAVELLAGALGLDTDPSNPSCGPGGEVKLQAKAVRLSPLKGEIGAIGGSVTGKMTLESMADTLLGWLVELEVEVGSGGGSGGGGGRDTTQQQQQQPLPKPPPPPPLLLHNLLTSDAPYDLQAAAALMLDRGLCTDGALRLSAADAAAVTAAGHGSALFATGGADCLAALPVALQLRILLSDGTLRSGAAAADVAGGAARCDAHLRLLSLLPRLSQAQCVIVCATVARRLELQQQQQRQQTALPNGSQTLLPAVEVVIAALLHCAHAAAAAAAAAAEGAAANEGIAELRQLLCLGEPCLVAVSAPAAAAQSAEPSSFSTYAGQTNQVLRKHCLIPVPHGEGSSGFDNGSGDGGASISSAAAASASSGGGIDSATVKCAAAAQRAALELVRDLGLGFRAGLDVCRLLLLAVDLGNWAAAAGLLAAARRHAEHLQQLSEELMDSRHHGTQITAALASLLFSAMARATQHSSSGACAFTSSQMACAQALPFAPQFLLQLLRRTRGGGHMGSSAALPPTSSADTTSLASVQMAGSAAPQLQPLLRPAQIDISPSRGERVTGEGWVAFLCGHRFSNAELRDIVLPATEKELQSSAQQWPVVAAVWRKQYTRGDGLSPAACPRCTLRVVQSMRVRSSDGGLPGRGGADLYSAAT
ncbi:hypothetical protein JKP88DRAFT_264714 [Tribonema minus]|uniref:Uncharacterized protein n=1 Tax=Tribonema minus TaxID=303371 RepID=A0A836CAW3_9STRA|nr:hypothetical protein JKP88DRAFT_264714 [Tribonema minus]